MEIFYEFVELFARMIVIAVFVVAFIFAILLIVQIGIAMFRVALIF